MSLANYTDLKASIALWLKRDDLTSVIPDFVALAESRISRDLRLRKQITTATLSTVAGTRGVTLPTDFLEAENLSLSNTSPPASLSQVSVEYLDNKFPESYPTGQPAIYSILGDQILLGPTPDAVYSLPIEYYAKFAALSVTPTNWLLTNHPSIYLFSALAESVVYTLDDARAPMWEQKYAADVQALQRADDIAVHSGSALRVRKI